MNCQPSGPPGKVSDASYGPLLHPVREDVAQPAPRASFARLESLASEGLTDSAGAGVESFLPGEVSQNSTRGGSNASETRPGRVRLPTLSNSFGYLRVVRQGHVASRTARPSPPFRPSPAPLQASPRGVEQSPSPALRTGGAARERSSRVPREEDRGAGVGAAGAVPPPGAGGGERARPGGALPGHARGERREGPGAPGKVSDASYGTASFARLESLAEEGLLDSAGAGV
jgi:hypothetical protein